MLSLFVVMVLVCCDPFCALQAYFEGVKASSNFNIIALDHKKKLKNNTFVANTGHFDNEIDFAHTEGFEGTEVDHIKPQKIVLVKRYMKLPSLVLSLSLSLTLSYSLSFLLDAE